MKTHWNKLRAFWRGGFSDAVFITAVSFGAVIVLFFAAGLLSEPLRAFVYRFFSEDLLGGGLLEQTGLTLFLALFVNNLRASALAVLVGLIPFLYLPAVWLGTNAALLGVLAAIFVKNGSSLLLYFAGILPHGVFELPALILSISCGLFLCRVITAYMRGRASGGAPAQLTLSYVLRVFILCVLPLLLAAALIEAYLTPAIVQAMTI